jgi:hypothetical protein
MLTPEEQKLKQDAIRLTEQLKERVVELEREIDLIERVLEASEIASSGAARGWGG